MSSLRFIFTLLITAVLCFSIHPLEKAALSSSANETLISFSESGCKSIWQGAVNTYTIFDGSTAVGSSIWLNRSTKRVKAKYFAHKLSGQTVHDRYEVWRQEKDILLMSSGAYATGWDSKDVPAGITVDNGVIVNRKHEPLMDGLVIIEAVGGVRVSNIEDRNLKLKSLGNIPMDVTTFDDKAKFLKWAQSEKATVFQTHLLIYNNALRVGANGSKKSTIRKFLILAKDANDTLFHIIFYLKNGSYTLYNSSRSVLSYFRNKGMNIVAAVNLDTGDYDIISTGSGVKNCNDDYIMGTRNRYRENLTNMLVYQHQ